MFKRTFHIAVSMIFILCAIYGPQIYAHPASINNLPVTCGKVDYKGAGLDKLATDLAKDTKVYRIQKSIEIRLPEREIFGAEPNALSHNGKQFIAQIAGDLTCYPETLIYIQENSGPSPASIYQAETQAFRVQSALRDEGVDINRLEIDLTTPPQLHQSNKAVDKKVLPASFFELKIIPRV